MADARGGALLQSVARLLTEKKAVMAREKEFVEGLNRVLNQMGYEVVSLGTVPRGEGTRRRRQSAGGRRRAPKRAKARVRRAAGRRERAAKPAASRGKATQQARAQRQGPSRKAS